MKLSAIIITKNEEEMLGDCLASLTFCDEIVVVDAGSTDSTLAIAKKYHAQIISVSESDFSARRNAGQKIAKGEWVLYVDADERVTKTLQQNIVGVLEYAQETYVAYKINRKNFYFGNHEWPKIEKLERLFVKKKLQGWSGKLHESPKIDGEVGELDGYLFHFTHRNLSSMIAKTMEWSKIEAALRFDAHHPRMTWWRFPRVMLSAFYDSYIGQSGWKVGTIGLIESMYQGFSMFITYARLWEMQQNKVKENEK